MHKAVLEQEATDACLNHQVSEESAFLYVDATFGRGGHSARLYAALRPQDRLLVLDQDPEAIEAAAQTGWDERFLAVQANFRDLAAVIRSLDTVWLNDAKVAAILVDLGVSSPQLDQAERGFSFLRDGPLDMRMNPQVGVTAAEWVNSVGLSEMIRVFKDYGQERYSKRIASAIIAHRENERIERTEQLALIVKEAHPNWEKGKHPATRVFQAIRIFVNQELSALETFLDSSLDVLVSGGHLSVISFHSLEDTLVKKFIQKAVKGDEWPEDWPITVDELNPTLAWVVKKCYPSADEIDENPRSRSAVLRVARKL